MLGRQLSAQFKLALCSLGIAAESGALNCMHGGAGICGEGRAQSWQFAWTSDLNRARGGPSPFPLAIPTPFKPIANNTGRDPSAACVRLAPPSPPKRGLRPERAGDLRG